MNPRFRKMKFRSILIPALAALLTVAFIACSSDDNGGSSNNRGDLVVYSGRSESLVDPIIQRFKEQTGIDVKVRYGNTGSLAATLLEEGGKTPADVFFAQDPGGLGAIESMLDTIPGDILGLVPEWARSPENKWVGISGRARVVIYNTDRIDPAELPDTLEGFTDPEWNGRIGWPPTNGSFQAMVTGMRILWGEERTRAWLEGIKANNPVEYAKNTPTVQAVADGEVDVGFVNHYYLHRFLAEEGDGFSARNYYPRGGGPGSVVLVAGAGIIDGADNRSQAREFLTFLLSKEAQQYFADETFEHPLIDGVQTSAGVPAVNDLARPIVDISDLGDLKATQALLRDVGVLP
ncbi:MAG: iron ABC transporter substrate-binding protein [Chloroflexi bacterium]|nr:iron ABC transporter substrate-binding protein [Chloroflexota bacterium]